ncbi:MAG: UDP-2,3-diacylglucosamine diphosphatase LpxI [Desulfocurvibacter africanus]
MADAYSGKGTLGLIAGGGRFPFLIADGARKSGLRVVAVGFRSNTDPGLPACVDEYQELRLGQLGKLIDFFKSRGVDRVLMGGTINKARAMDIIPDFRGARLLLKLGGKGDDALLRVISDELASEGMPVRRAHELIPELLMPEGFLAGRRPSPEIMADIRFGWSVAKELGRLDIGQTVVVRRQVVAAVEALEGTDNAIRRGCSLAGQGAVVVKVFKPGQDERLDLPSVGLTTIETMREAGAACLAVEAGRSLFFDREQALSAANRAGIAVVGVSDSLLAGD